MRNGESKRKSKKINKPSRSAWKKNCTFRARRNLMCIIKHDVNTFQAYILHFGQLEKKNNALFPLFGEIIITK